MKQKIYILLALLTMAVGASARGGEGDLYFVELTADSKPEGASFTMTYTEGSNAAQDVSTSLIDEVAPVPAGALVTLAVTPVTGYGVTSVKAETFMYGSEMRARTRGTDAAEDITILGDVEMTKSASDPNTYTFTMPTANVRIALGYKYIVTADMISFGMSGEFTYDKTEKKPDVVVKFNSGDVTKDFDISYSNNVKAAAKDAKNAPTVTVTAKATSERFTGSASTTFTISQATLYVKSGITASDKVYDGTATATIDCSKAVLEGLVSGDKVTVTGVTGAFNWVEVYADNYVNLNYENASLSGTDAGNYTLDKVNSQKTATASITSGGDDQPGTTVVKNEDGTTTTTTVTIEDNVDGYYSIKTITETTTDANGKVVKSIETVVVTYGDGKQTTTETTTEITRDAHGNVVKSIKTVAVTDGDGKQTTTETTTEITRDADGNVVNSVETVVVSDNNGIQSTTVTTIETKADGTVRKDVLETFADGTLHESVTETAPDNSMKVTETKTYPDGTTETSEKFVGKPTLGEESNVTDPVNGKTESFSKVEDNGSGILSAITNASLSVATADADNISLVQSSQIVEKNGEVVKSEYSQSLKAKKGSSNIRLVVSASLDKTFEKNAMKKGLSICTNKGDVRGFGSQLKKVSLKAHTRADGSDDGMIEIESGVEYEILTDGDLILTLMTSESDVEITSINIIEPDAPTEYATISISKAKQVPYCSEYNLDFTDKPELKAYVATGYDKAKGTIWLTRVKKVPAGTGFLLTGEEGNYEVPVSESASDCYYKNMFKGTLEGMTIQTTDGDYTNYYLSNGTAGVGFYKVTNENGVSIKANRCYLPIPTDIPAEGSEGSEVAIKVTDALQVPYYTSQSLDFTTMEAQGVKAYTATGYNYASGTIWLTRVKKVPAETGVLVMAEKSGTYNVPTASVQSVYENMFVGSLTAQTIYTNETIDGVDYVNYYLSKGNAGVGFYKVTNPEGVKMGANRCYLPIPKRDAASGARGKNSETEAFCQMILSDESNDDVIAIPVFGGMNGEDDGTTGISTQFQNAEQDVYFNLQGQRVENPGKGIYIHNGRRVVIRSTTK